MSLTDIGFLERPVIEANIRPWMKKAKMELVTTGAHMRRVVDECIETGYYALDLETTGLDTRVFPRETPEGTILKTNVEVVGLCLSAKKNRGYYIPVRHCPGDDPSDLNIPFHDYDRELRRLVESDAIAVVFNCKFEGEVLTFNGGEPYGDWDDINNWEDVLILGYLDDSTRRSKTLKTLSKTLLGKEQIELDELFPPKTKHLDFSQLHPDDPGVLEYAAGDAICTFELYEKLKVKALKLPSEDGNGNPHSQKFVYRVEKLCTPSVRWMEHYRLHIDLDKTADLIQLGQGHLYLSLKEVYQGASDILGRDIMPLSFYLMSRYIEETNPEMAISDDMGESFNSLVDRFRKEAKIFLKRYRKQDRGVMKLCETGLFPTTNPKAGESLMITLKTPLLGKLAARTDPPAKGGVSLSSEYDVLAPAQLGVLMWDLGVPGLKKTPTGQIATGKDILDDIIEEAKHEYPFVDRIKWMRGNQNALGKLYAIFTDTDRIEDTLKISFRQFATATGRFSSKGDKRKHLSGGTTFNLQSMPATYDTNRPPALLRIRECVVAPPGWTMVAIDFGGVELRLAANLSHEEKWIEAFFRCSACGMTFDRGNGKSTPEAPPIFCPQCGEDKIGDIHTLTAIQVFGEAAQKRDDWKELRKQGKASNFALSYGGGPAAIHRNTGCGKQAAYRIAKQFKAKYMYLQKWWARTRDFAKKYGYVLTAFQRKFPLPDIKHEESFIRAKAERNAVNSPIQGSSADITKLSMGLAYREVKKRGWLDKVRMVITMHDELVFEIHNSILEEACQVFSHIMVRNKAILGRRWPVPLTVDVELGPNWTVKHNLTAIKYILGVRRKLQQPGLSEDEIRALLRCINGFYGGHQGVREKLGSFEDIQWPATLKPHFETGRYDLENGFTEEEKEALKKAWDLFFSTEDPNLVPEAEEEKADTRVVSFRIPRLSEEVGEKLARAIFSTYDPEGHRLELFDPNGDPLDDWFPDEIRVNAEGFNVLMNAHV